MIFLYFWRFKVSLTKNNPFILLFKFGFCYLELQSIDIFTFSCGDTVGSWELTFSHPIHLYGIWFSRQLRSIPGHFSVWKQLEKSAPAHQNVTRRALSRRVIFLASDSLRAIWRKQIGDFSMKIFDILIFLNIQSA